LPRSSRRLVCVPKSRSTVLNPQGEAAPRPGRHARQAPALLNVSRLHVLTFRVFTPQPHSPLPTPQPRSDQVRCINVPEYQGARRACGTVAGTRNLKTMTRNHSQFRLLPAGFEATRLATFGRKNFCAVTVLDPSCVLHEVPKKQVQPARASSLAQDWGFLGRFGHWLRNGSLRDLCKPAGNCRT
jgi:uncharacterized protein YfaQ (DUF2300 family)